MRQGALSTLKLWGFGLSLVLWTGSAFAAPPPNLEAIGRAAAAANGVPWDVFNAQIQGESGWNPDTGCNSYGACGIAQFIGPTARSLGVNTSDPTSSLYGAAFYDAQLYAKTGSWAGALTKYTGGLTPSNPGNPAYADAFAAAATADAGGVATVSGSPLATSTGTAIIPSTPGATIDPASLGLGSGSGLTIGDGSTLTGPAAPAAAPVADPPTFRPATFLWNKWQGTIAVPLKNNIEAVRAKAGGVVGVLALIAVSVMALGLMYGLRRPDDVKRKLFKISIVAGVVGSGGAYPWFVDLVNSIPGWLGEGFALDGQAGGPPGIFDNIITTFLVSATATMKAAPYLSGEMFLDLGLIGLAGLGFGVPWAVMYAVWFCAQVVGSMILIVGAIMFLMLLSDHTESIFWNYVRAFVGLSMVSLMAIIMAVIAMQLMQGVFDGLPHAASATTMAGNLLLGAIAILVIAVVLVIIWKTIEHITQSAAHAQLAQSAQQAVNTIAGGVARGAAGAAGTAGAVGSSKIVSFPRPSTPVGRSVSRGGP